MNVQGFGILSPFQRDRKRDFAAGGGAALLRSAVEQILGTRASSDFVQGELPWRPEFGSLLFLLRHQKNDVALQELARVYVADALARWEPRIELRAVSVSRDGADGNRLEIRLSYDVVQQNRAANQVVLEGVEQTITL